MGISTEMAATKLCDNIKYTKKHLKSQLGTHGKIDAPVSVKQVRYTAHDTANTEGFKWT